MLTTAILAARYFRGNFTTARQYMYDHHGMARPGTSNLNRHLHRLGGRLNAIFMSLGATLKDLNTESRYLIDSFPVAVCRNIRIKRCRLLRGGARRGFNASKREYFYGFKVQVITTECGIPVYYFVAAGSFHDMTPNVTRFS